MNKNIAQLISDNINKLTNIYILYYEEYMEEILPFSRQINYQDGDRRIYLFTTKEKAVNFAYKNYISPYIDEQHNGDISKKQKYRDDLDQTDVIELHDKPENEFFKRYVAIEIMESSVDD